MSFLEKPNVPPLTKEIAYKILVYGSAAVGKTSLVKFLNNEDCNNEYFETNGINITQIFYQHQDGNRSSLIKLQFWDVGYNFSLNYAHILPDCLKEVDLILCLFSFNDKASFNNLGKIISDFKKNSFKIPPHFVIVGTKSDDISHKFISQHQIRKFQSVEAIPIVIVTPISESTSSRRDLIKKLCDILKKRDEDFMHKSGSKI